MKWVGPFHRGRSSPCRMKRNQWILAWLWWTWKPLTDDEKPPPTNSPLCVFSLLAPLIYFLDYAYVNVFFFVWGLQKEIEYKVSLVPLMAYIRSSWIVLSLCCLLLSLANLFILRLTTTDAVSPSFIFLLRLHTARRRFLLPSDVVLLLMEILLWLLNWLAFYFLLYYLKITKYKW